MDFLHTFTIVLPGVTRTVDNSSLPLTGSNFWFPSDHSYINLPSITRTMLQAPDKWKKVYYSPKHWNYFNNHVFFVLNFFSPFKIQCPALCIYQALKCACYSAFIPRPIYSFSDIYFRFSLKVRVIGSRLYNWLVIVCKIKKRKNKI